jgi:hypothetical protein
VEKSVLALSAWTADHPGAYAEAGWDVSDPAGGSVPGDDSLHPAARTNVAVSTAARLARPWNRIMNENMHDECWNSKPEGRLTFIHDEATW